MSTASFTVDGMTCQHCVASVTEEINEIPGVTGVEVDLATGAVTVTSDDPVPTEDVQDAVRAAGYQMAQP